MMLDLIVTFSNPRRFVSLALLCLSSGEIIILVDDSQLRTHCSWVVFEPELEGVLRVLASALSYARLLLTRSVCCACV